MIIASVGNEEAVILNSNTDLLQLPSLKYSLSPLLLITRSSGWFPTSKLYDTSYYNDNNKEFKMNNEKRIRSRQPYVKKQNDTVVVIDIEEDNYKDKIMENTFKDRAILIAKGSELVHYVDRLMEYKNIQFVVD